MNIVSYLYYSDWVLHGILSTKHVDPLVSSSHCRVHHSLRHGCHRLPLVEHTVVPGSIIEICVSIRNLCVFYAVRVDNYSPPYLSTLFFSRLSGPMPPRTKMKWR